MLNPNQKLSHDELIAKIHEGNKDAFGLVYTEYYDELLYFTTKLLNDKDAANGIISETFIKLWDRRLNFPSIKNMRSFLHVTCRNNALNMLRDNKTNPTIFTTEFPDQYYVSEAETRLIEAELLDQVYKELLHLSPNQKAIIELLIQGKSTKEICEKLQISADTLRKTKYKAVTRLRQEIQIKNLLSWLFFF